MELFLALLMAFLLPSAGSVYFNYSRFDTNTQGILYTGDGAPSQGEIDFINEAWPSRIGWAVYGENVPLWNSETGKMADFSTHFVFSIDTLGASSYGHELAFFLGLVGFQIPSDSASGFLGLFNTTTMNSDKGQIVLVETSPII